MTTTNKEKFVLVLADQYTQLFESPAYNLVKSGYSPLHLAEKMTNGLIAKATDKDGEGIRRTCKVLGLKHTYKAIEQFLK